MLPTGPVWLSEQRLVKVRNYGLNQIAAHRISLNRVRFSRLSEDRAYTFISIVSVHVPPAKVHCFLSDFARRIDQEGFPPGLPDYVVRER